MPYPFGPLALFILCHLSHYYFRGRRLGRWGIVNFILSFSGNIPVFHREAGSLIHSHSMLANESYKFVGLVVAMRLVHWHPGPKCFNLMITKYIVHGTQPAAYTEEEMVAADCIMALQKVNFHAKLWFPEVTCRYM